MPATSPPRFPGGDSADTAFTAGGLGSGSVAPPVTGGPAEAPASPTPRRKHLGYGAGQARLRRRLLALIIDNIVCIPLVIPC
ncbi:MAG: hypothetical protein M3Z95_00260, partial [Actinomycetota bacterium]|nr:hypothetical protein [Actinomycetota bacterium]